MESKVHIQVDISFFFVSPSRIRRRLLCDGPAMVLDRGIGLVKAPELQITVWSGLAGTHDLCFRTFPAAILSCRLSWATMMRG